MSDYIAVMDQGRLQQFGNPIDLYMRPKNKFVTEFFGEINVLSGKLVKKNLITIIGNFPFKYSGKKNKFSLVIRSEGFKLINMSNKSLFNKINKENIIKSPNYGRIIECKFLGGNTIVHLSVTDKNYKQHLHVKIPGINYYKKNQFVYVFTDVNYSFIFES